MSILFYEARMSSAAPVAWALVELIVACMVGYGVFGAGVGVSANPQVERWLRACQERQSYRAARSG
jgi:hypothetical protein